MIGHRVLRSCQTKWDHWYLVPASAAYDAHIYFHVLISAMELRWELGLLRSDNLSLICQWCHKFPLHASSSHFHLYSKKWQHSSLWQHCLYLWWYKFVAIFPVNQISYIDKMLSHVQPAYEVILYILLWNEWPFLSPCCNCHLWVGCEKSIENGIIIQCVIVHAYLSSNMFCFSSQLKYCQCLHNNELSSHSPNPPTTLLSWFSEWFFKPMILFPPCNNWCAIDNLIFAVLGGLGGSRLPLTPPSTSSPQLGDSDRSSPSSSLTPNPSQSRHSNMGRSISHSPQDTNIKSSTHFRSGI
mgnify:CR=1 FL=1